MADEEPRKVDYDTPISAETLLQLINGSIQSGNPLLSLFKGRLPYMRRGSCYPSLAGLFQPFGLRYNRSLPHRVSFRLIFHYGDVRTASSTVACRRNTGYCPILVGDRTRVGFCCRKRIARRQLVQRVPESCVESRSSRSSNIGLGCPVGRPVLNDKSVLYNQEVHQHTPRLAASD